MWNGIRYDPPRTYEIEKEEPILLKRVSELNIIWLVVDNPNPINLVWEDVLDDDSDLKSMDLDFSGTYQDQMRSIVKMPVVRENYMEFYPKE